MYSNSHPGTEGSFVSVNYTYGNDDEMILCIKCQKTDKVKDRVLHYSGAPRATYLTFLLGPLAALIALGVSSHNHVISLPYCSKCWNKYRLASILAGLSVLGFCGALIGGVALMLQFNSGYWFWPLPIMSIILMLWLFYWKQTTYPKVKYVDKASIVLVMEP